MKLTVHLEGSNRSELVKGLQAHLALLNGAGEETTSATRNTKNKNVEEAEEETETHFEDNATEETEAEIDQAGEEVETPEEEEVTVDQVRKAFSAYTKKLAAKPGMTPESARAKAVGLLKKNFKVERIDKLAPKQLVAALAAVS